MKKLILLLLLSVLTVGSINEVFASSMGGGGSSFEYEYQCDCKGDWINYYSDIINDPFIWCLIGHELTPIGTWDCVTTTFARLQSHEIGSFYIQYLIENSDGGTDMYVGYLDLSEDTVFDSTTFGGEVYTCTLDSYTTSNFGGESNGKYYGGWIYSFASGTYEINHGTFDYVVECSDYNSARDKFHELAKYLCGENSVIPDGVTVGKQPDMYDLEPPLDVKVTTVELDLFTNIPYKIWWNQSNIDLTGYNTVFYVKGYGEYKPSVFSAFKDIETSWMFEESIVTAKYCNNNLKYFDYSYEDMEKDLRAIAENVEGDSIYQVKNNSVDFMIRNEKEDENGQMHYSNWVYVNTYEDGTYSVFEMNTDYSLDEDSDETGQINTDSTIYDDEIVYEDNEETLDVGGVSNVGSFIKVMKDLANSLKTFPEFFAKMFSFLPSWVLTCIGILFIIILICAIF